DVVPGQEERDFPAEGGIPEGDEDPPHGLVLQRPDKPLDNGDASMAPNRTESQLEAAFLRPSMKGVCVELRAAIDDEVLGSRQSLHGWVVRPSLRGDLEHPGILDPHLLAEQADLLADPTVL